MEPKHLYIAGSLQAAWQQKDFDLLQSILAEDVMWHEGPYEQALTSPESVVEQWQRDLFNQQDISASVTLADFVDERGYFKFEASWVDNRGEPFELNGVFIMSLTEEGKVQHFMQWWAAQD